MLLECRGLNVTVEGRDLVRGLDLELASGQLLAVLGPNGAGKTLLLHTLAGIRPAAGGEVRVQGRPLPAWPKRELARQLALLPQNVEDPFPATVIETVLLGRHPHISRWRWEDAGDLALARAALESVGLHGYEQRDVFTLSGGERRRTAIAAVLAQTPAVFLMDEPTNHLDPSHQLETLQLLRARADAGAAVMVTIHDPNLAARFADRALLIESAGTWTCGAADGTLNAANLSRLFATQFESIEQDGRRLFFQA
jgi:iron complex transport system ATP-binding protein